MLPASIFDRFRQAILSLPVMAENEKYNRTALTCPRFLLFREAGLEAYYAPFHHLNKDAVQFLNERNDIGLDRRCLTGFPHPSGANGHRRSDFQHGRERWSSQLAA